MMTSRHSHVLRRRAHSGALTAFYVFGLLATMGHLACAHAVCPCVCHGEQAAQSTVRIEACNHHHESSKHTDLSVADQKPLDGKVRPVALLTSTHSITDTDCQVTSPTETTPSLHTSEILTTPARAPPHLRFV